MSLFSRNSSLARLFIAIGKDQKDGLQIAALFGSEGRTQFTVGAISRSNRQGFSSGINFIVNEKRAFEDGRMLQTAASVAGHRSTKPQGDRGTLLQVHADEMQRLSRSNHTRLTKRNVHAYTACWQQHEGTSESKEHKVVSGIPPFGHSLQQPLHQDGKREKSRGEMYTRENTSISSQDLYADAEECDEAIEDLENVRKRVQNWKRLPPGHVPLTIRVKNFVTTVVNGVKTVIAFTVSIPGRVYRFSQLPKEERKATYAGWSAAIKSEAKHYWLGTKLLWKDVKIASRILSRVLAGKTLSRRERQQLTRTTADIFRVVPMMVFLVIPFMELLLPVALKLFPNMLPSTFEDKLKKEEEMKRRIGARLEIAKFLQDTVAEMAGDITAHRSGDTRTSAAELYSFMQRVRAGENVNTSELLKFAKLFNDELTLDNLERVQLVSLCRFVGISPFGTDAFLRTRLRSHLLEIKADDRDIQEEGIESLTEDELRQACRARGMRAPFGEGAVKFMRQQLAEWLDWSLNRSLPSSLLLLSRAFTVTTPIGQPSSVDVSSIRETLSTMPEEVVEDVELFATSDGGDKNEAYERKLELLEREEELIREEQECEVEFDFPTMATTGTVAEKTATAAAAAVVKEAAASSLADVLDRESEEEKSVKAAAAKQAKMQKILKYVYLQIMRMNIFSVLVALNPFMNRQ